MNYDQTQNTTKLQIQTLHIKVKDLTCDVDMTKKGKDTYKGLH